MRRPNRTRACPAGAVLLLGLLIPGAADAAGRGEMDIGAFAGLFLPGTHHELYDPVGARHLELKPGPGLGIRWSYQPHVLAGFGVETEFVPSGTRGGGGALLNATRVEAMLWSPTETGATGFASCLVFGAGVLGVAADDADVGKDLDLAVHWGLGAEYGLSQTLRLRADLRHALSASWGYTKTPASFLGINVGIAYRLLPRFQQERVRAPKDTDKDGIPDPADTCVTAAEVSNGYMDDDGCPDKLSTLRIVVLSPDGKPVPGASVLVGGSPTGETGTAGEIVVADQMPGTSVAVEALLVGGRYLPSAISTVALGEGEQSQEVRLQWAPSKVKVHAHTAAGAPVAGEIFFLGPSDVPAATIDASGNATIELPNGTWTLMFETPQGLQRKEITVEAGKDVTLDVQF